MKITKARFVASYPNQASCPKTGLPEFAFIGRSNVGKSSLINMLTGQKGLAKVSATPGKTRLINYFLVDESWYLVDLPGYGYARASKVEQRNLSRIIADYFANRRELVNAFVLIDANIPPTRNDLEFLDRLGDLQAPFSLIFTKVDRAGEQTIRRNIELFFAKMSETWAELPLHFVSSSVRRTGREEILEYIENMIEQL